MGCAPSRPSESFYQEFFVERPEKKAKEKRSAANTHTQPNQNVAKPNDTNAGAGVVQETSADHAETRELTYEEKIARADLRIYQEEMKARKAEEEHKIYLLYRAIDGNGDWIF